ncbi:EAL domain-containing protein [Maricaulis parjimensis]|uniref:EAL domain-containing protein n=1 Tax=Maricaulis parjimensis TaxID=144023 RepID=UPI00193A6822|nr:EAL domain-containing protein [Maricaulis parjimensis]
MTQADFEAGVRAAGAVAFAYDAVADRLVLTGDPAAVGLSQSEFDWAGFLARLGPADQARLEAALGTARIDLRIRVIGEEGRLSYVRLMGQRVSETRIEGLMTPAGSSAMHADRISEEHALARGVENGDVLAWFQPIIALDTGCLAGFEALARWDRPELGVIGPDDFLDMADDLDLLERISDCVREHAATELSAWRSAHDMAQSVFVSANATVSELVDPDFCDRLIERVQAARLPAGQFKLEIAETEIMRDPERAAESMARLSEAGIALALDDFGTGYSSLARLDMLPFDIVKIDRYFVRAMTADEAAGTVVKSVIQLATHFGMKVVAEGVETEDAAHRLGEMGCHFAQGFRYAGALSPEAAGQAIRAGIAGRFRAPSA